MALCDNGCSVVLNRVHVQQLHLLPSLLLWGLHNIWELTPAWSCDFCVNMTSKQAKFEFLPHNIQHYDANAVHRRKLRSPGHRHHVTLINRWVSMCCQALIFVASQLSIQNVTHARLFAKYTAYLIPQPCGKHPQVCMLSRFTKIILVKVWILNKAPVVSKISACNSINYPKKKYYFFIAKIWTIFLIRINMCDRGRMLTHMQIPRLHPSWNGWWIIMRTSSWLTHGRTVTQIRAGNDNTGRPTGLG